MRAVFRISSRVGRLNSLCNTERRGDRARKPFRFCSALLGSRRPHGCNGQSALMGVMLDDSGAGRFRLTEFRRWGRVIGMEVTMQIPDDIANRLTEGGGDLSRRALEALAAEEYKQGHLTKPDLRRLFGFETSYEIDGFLKAHNVYDEYTMEDFERERQALKELGF